MPLDKVQNQQSIKKNFLEEVYEAIEPSTTKTTSFKRRLGDVLFRSFSQPDGVEDKRFSIGDVIDGICQKLIRRHPPYYRGGYSRHRTMF
jgi:tetrapyrrole methylase family protein/MazG family protein